MKRRQEDIIKSEEEDHAVRGPGMGRAARSQTRDGEDQNNSPGQIDQVKEGRSERGCRELNRR